MESTVLNTIKELTLAAFLFAASQIGGQKAFNARCTVWASKLQCPLLSLSLSSTSFNDPALAMACEAMRKNFREQHGEAGRFELCYLDAPNRDGKGAVRLLDLPSGIPGKRVLECVPRKSPMR